MCGVTVIQSPAERVFQPAGRGNIIATNLSLILADKNQKIPARVIISHFNNRIDENTLTHNFLLHVKPLKKITDLKFLVHQSEKFSVLFPKFFDLFRSKIYFFKKKI